MSTLPSDDRCSAIFCRISGEQKGRCKTIFWKFAGQNKWYLKCVWVGVAVGGDGACQSKGVTDRQAMGTEGRGHQRPSWTESWGPFLGLSNSWLLHHFPSWCTGNNLADEWRDHVTEKARARGQRQGGSNEWTWGLGWTSLQKLLLFSVVCNKLGCILWAPLLKASWDGQTFSEL